MTIGARLARFNWEAIVAVATALLIWHLGSAFVDNEVLLPPPRDVIQAWWGLMLTTLPEDILASILHLVFGYSLGVTTGLVLAVLTYRSRYAEWIIDPLVELLRPIGGIAWIPLAIAFFGISRTVPVFLIWYVSLIPVYLNALAGLRATDRRLIDCARTLGAKPGLITLRILLPSALPLVLTGLRLSLGVSWMAMVAAELVGADAGLGWRTFWYEQFFAQSKSMAVILTIGAIGYALDSLLRLAQRRFVRWHPRDR
jgi:ABC-type nitrate/sulfonate/bicarbonate transport system permease component